MTAPKPKTYKQLVEKMSEMETESDLNAICYEIDWSFQQEKITWKDHETLYKLAGMAGVTVR